MTLGTDTATQRCHAISTSGVLEMHGIVDWSSFEVNGTVVTPTTIYHSPGLTIFIV